MSDERFDLGEPKNVATGTRTHPRTLRIRSKAKTPSVSASIQKVNFQKRENSRNVKLGNARVFKKSRREFLLKYF